MSDFTVPSYRVRPQRAGFQVPWRMLALSGAVLGIAAAGGGVVWGITRAVNRSVPTIEADSRPIRVKPEDPGGLRVANQDERIFDSARRGPAAAAGQARLTPESERPDLAALRQAAARAQQAAAAEAAARPVLVNPSIATPPPAGASAAPLAAQPAPAPAQPAATQGAASPQGAQQQAAAAAPQPAPQAPVPSIAPPPMPANAPAAVQPRGGRFVVQLGAVTSEEAAQGEWLRLQGRIPELAGRQPQISRVDRGDLPPLWRIRTSGLPDAKAAEALCASAKSKGAPCAVIGG
ncbi:SPOR domain-containing protein [Muricoccus pecuniae]|uniref:Cell division septation protein DedD n=1 Tax=Muricoccus pecuniae TaxID=693023 RepID=A0A840YHY0_9PROT|nr:SPOR domain-containing protein [Roseomonas pecuniae]MBB5693603.1 cell division septation protein DedD [Roseomonas pecuniae]